MSVRDQFKLLVGGLNARRARPAAKHSAVTHYLDRSRLVSVLIFLITVTTIVLISSARLSTATVPVLPNQVATVRVVSSASFSYESEERTRIAKEQLMERVPPVYRLEMEPLQKFEAAARDLLSQLELFEQRHPANSPAATTERRQALAAIADSFNSRGGFRASVEDIGAILTAGDARLRAGLFDNGLAALRDIYAQGVQDGSLTAGPNGATVFQIARPNGEITQRPVQSMEDALTFLRVNLAAEGV
ncbi:MAG TPA: phosphohydrolase, partial [Opitutus sp.]|nr:phosphohydrolase [Opitutus sp.]